MQVDSDLPVGATEEAQAAAQEAASELLSLPWELLHDGRGWLFQGKHAVRVRRRLPNRHRQDQHSTALPVRILLLSPRPEKNANGNPIGYLDHRVSARPLTEAVESLGDLARLTVLQPPTYAALEQALQDGDQGNPFDVVHFDGHGVYDRRLGLGGLCFEDPNDEEKWEQRTLDFVDAAKLAGLVRQHRIPPVLYQEEHDPQLITKIPPQIVRQLAAKDRRLALGDLPEPPSYHFQGRSRELLGLERSLHAHPWAVVRGTGGQGKTTLAVELARWLVRTARSGRAAFVSLEHHRDARAVLDTLGHQLVGPHYSVAEYTNLDEALQPVERALADQPSIVVVDNCESVLPERAEPAAALDDLDASSAIFALCRRLVDADPRTRLIFTTRESLPTPFDDPGRSWELGALDRTDAIELVGEVMKQNGWSPPHHDTGDTPQEVIDLVEAVNRHARALVLLAGEVARGGVTATTQELRALMAHLQQQHPGDRENSLYASVELSLRRLSTQSRQHVRALAVCHGGVHLTIISMLTGLEQDPARELGAELIDIGLAEDMGDGHLRLDPGLAPYLLGELAADEIETLRSDFAEGMAQLTNWLNNRVFKDAQLASRLTLLEMPNLLEMLDWIQDHWPPEKVVRLATKVEEHVAHLGHPQALARAARVREQAAQKLGDWSHARFLAESARINRLLERGDVPAAYTASQELLDKSLAVGEAAYPRAAYDIAIAHTWHGNVLRTGGAAEAALVPLAEAQRRFQQLADAGSKSAENMVATTIAETGGCLLDLGRLDDAARAYEDQIRRHLALGDRRNAAAGKGQLGTGVRLRRCSRLTVGTGRGGSGTTRRCSRRRSA